MRIIIGVTGATGVEMSYRLLQALNQIKECEIHLVVSKGAALTWKLECAQPIESLYNLADKIYEEDDLAADISSGSFVTDGMIILPCSMKTLAGIVSGYAENLIQRSADVCLKENRKVVLVPREMPLSRIHLRNMKEAADCGCVIVPPVLTFYNQATSIEKQIDHIIGKILMQFGITYSKFQPWNSTQKEEVLKND